MRAKAKARNTVPANQPAPSTRANEMGDAVRGEISRCAARTYDHAVRLANVGDQSLVVASEILRDAGASELLKRSHWIRGVVAHALSILAELECEAGRLDALAALRSAQ